jgi:hypothetical protein
LTSFNKLNDFDAFTEAETVIERLKPEASDGFTIVFLIDTFTAV